MARPLDGIRVLDWTIFQQGPVATMMLGDLGAEVIKIEERVGGDPGRGVMQIAGSKTGGTKRNYYFEANNRQKKSLTLDLKKTRGAGDRVSTGREIRRVCPEFSEGGGGQARRRLPDPVPSTIPS